MPRLFEYHNAITVPDPQGLKNYLHSIWQERYVHLVEGDSEGVPDSQLQGVRNYQPFLSFDGDQIRARNYVGFIQFQNLHLELYPKVFKREELKPGMMLKHLFFWFDYCRKWKFPFTKSNLDSFDDINLPELIIYLMASKMLDTVSTQPISLYQIIEESLYSPKGRINFNRYLSSSFINGKHHAIDCDHEPFVFDNRLNRTIKYVSRLLLSKTKFAENQGILQEIVFLLDDVEDQVCTYADLENVVLSPLFADYADIKDICKIVLQQSIYANQEYDLSQWCLLFPMEYVFEDFVAGFLQDKFSSDWLVEYQKSNTYLSDDPQAFQLQHDIFLTSRKTGQRIIVDTKYKLREGNFKDDKKKGVSQADMYQVTSYALKRGCTDVLLLYPNIQELVNKPDSFVIQSGFSETDKINITAAEIPFWSADSFNALSSLLQERLANYLELIGKRNTPTLVNVK